MLCTIKRPATTSDSFGAPAAPTLVAADVACHWWSQQSWAAKNTESPGMIAVTVEHILFAPGQDVRAGDLITTVTDHLGNVVFTEADSRLVEHAAVMRNHIDCRLRMGEGIGGRSC